MSRQLLNTPSCHARSLVGLADDAWTLASGALVSLASIPLAKVAETAVLSVLKNIKHGNMRIMTSSKIYSFPDPSTKGPVAELRVVNDNFWTRLMLMSDLGFAEAYMYGEVECDDLVAVFQVFLDNRKELGGIENSFTSWLFSVPQTLTSYRFLNTISNSRSNISAHYDISNAMFQAFLSEDMTYSCGIFDRLDADVKPAVDETTSGHSSVTLASPQNEKPLEITEPIQVDGLLLRTSSSTSLVDELHEAQLRKIRHILKKARIRPGDRVLEIGSGWGSLAIAAVQLYGCEVDTITLSVHQKLLAEERIAKAGLSGAIRVHLMDYRALPQTWKGIFDRVISVEMLEAVGKDFLETYWRVVDWALDTQTGVAVVQVITIPEARFAKYEREVDFIRKWIFPGGFLPTVSLLVESIQKGSSGRLVVDSLANIGPHYARTLREWRKRFDDSFESHIVPALKAEHPELSSGQHGLEEIEVFRRKWIYYFCYCEIGFTTRSLGDQIITMTREGNAEFGCSL